MQDLTATQSVEDYINCGPDDANEIHTSTTPIISAPPSTPHVTQSSFIHTSEACSVLSTTVAAGPVLMQPPSTASLQLPAIESVPQTDTSPVLWFFAKSHSSLLASETDIAATAVILPATIGLSQPSATTLHAETALNTACQKLVNDFSQPSLVGHSHGPAYRPQAHAEPYPVEVPDLNHDKLSFIVVVVIMAALLYSDYLAILFCF